MHGSLTKHAIVLPAIVALTLAAAALEPSGTKTTKTEPKQGFEHIDLKVHPINVFEKEPCDCKRGIPLQLDNHKCVPLTPAERMGMTIRVASL